ncbi:MAG: glycosyltransferase family 2 protein [Thermodesulfobacteria bacterium]|nr:glycosyltransferase family 2 protein [Thermodesulfobacteriota bacterium]
MLNVSIVLYKNDPEQLTQTIRSVLKSNLVKKLYLIDNSPTDKLKKLSQLGERIEYTFNKANLGFGKAHNIALKKSIKENVKYHLVLNPDIHLESEVLEKLYDFMEKNPDVGLVMPKILYPDGKIQYLCKLLPTPMDLFGRRFLDWGPFKSYVKKRNELYELRFTGYDKLMEVPFLSGCFMFLRVSILKKVGLFDERFFLYFEDTDLSRRIHKVAKTIYYPYVHVYHEHQKWSYKNFKLLKIHIKSAIKYFNKWGWFNDPERKTINKKILEKLNYNILSK